MFRGDEVHRYSEEVSKWYVAVDIIMDMEKKE